MYYKGKRLGNKKIFDKILQKKALLNYLLMYTWTPKNGKNKMAVPLLRGKQGEKQAHAHNNKTFCFFSSYLCFLSTTWPNVFIVFLMINYQFML